MFAGRFNELKILERCLFQTKMGNPEHFLIHGERGIGKSSLLYYTSVTAEGKITNQAGETLRFIVVNVELEPASDYREIVYKVGASLKRALDKRNDSVSKAKAAWDFLKKWEVMGVKYSEELAERSASELLEELCNNIADVVERLSGEIDGMAIFIDEADQAPTSANLGEFAKILTERLPKLGCHRTCLGLAGVSNVVQRMSESHGSSLRIFTMLNLQPLTEDERRQVIERGLAEANQSSGDTITIADDAMDWIVQHSEGYPQFIQQYAYSAFDAFAAKDGNEIQLLHVILGAFVESGAIEQLGAKYFEQQYFKKIGSDEYRTVLHVMAKHGTDHVSKATLRKETGLTESTLSNALKALRDRRIIMSNPRKTGEYCLPTKSFASWIRAFTEGRTEQAIEALNSARAGGGQGSRRDNGD
jgi:DNA-directed RNA polymerase subunit F